MAIWPAAVAATQRVSFDTILKPPGPGIDARDWPWYFREQNVQAKGRRRARWLRQEERAAGNEDKGIASTPRGPVGASTISSTHVPLRYAYARAYVKDAPWPQPLQRFIRCPVQTARELSRVIYRPAICRRWDSYANRPTFFSTSVARPPRFFSRHFN